MSLISTYPSGIFEVPIGDMMFTVFEQNWLEGRNKFGQEIKLHPHFHSMFEFQYIISNRLTLKTQKNTYCINCDDYIIIPPSIYHWTNYNTEAFERYVFIFSVNPNGITSEGFSEFQYYLHILQTIDKPVIRRNRLVSDCVRSILDFESKKDAVRMEDVHKIRILLSNLFLAITEDVNKGRMANTKPLPGFSREKLQLQNEINDYIVRNYASNSFAQDLAQHLFMSQRNVNRTVNELFGVPVSVMLLNQRMNCAWKYLTDTSLTVDKIAGLTGYNSYNTFYRAFRKYYGFSPEKLRIKTL